MANLTGRQIPQKAAKERKERPTRTLRDNAKGQSCTLRLPGCRNDPAYTVLAHYRRFGWAGVAQKPNDLLACFSCDVCHAKQEAHHPDCTDADLLRALGETLVLHLRGGAISVA